MNENGYRKIERNLVMFLFILFIHFNINQEYHGKLKLANFHIAYSNRFTEI